MQSFQDQTAMQHGLPMNNAPLNAITHTQPRSGVSQEYAVKGVKILSILQITLGFLAIIFQIWDIFNYSAFSYIGTGIWTGALFIIAGSLGVHSSKTKKICVISYFLMVSIIASGSSAALLVFSAISVAHANNDREYVYEASRIDLVIAISTILLLISLIAATVAIVSSAYACHALSCSSKYEQRNVLTQGQVQYIDGPNSQNQMISIPMPNIPNVMSTSSPHQLTGFWNHSFPSAQGEMLTVQAEAPSQAPTYLGQTDPPPSYEESDPLRPLHKSF